MGCNCGGGKKVTAVAKTERKVVNSGDYWEAVLSDGTVVSKPTKRAADALVAMRGGRVRRVTRRQEGS